MHKTRENKKTSPSALLKSLHAKDPRISLGQLAYPGSGLNLLLGRATSSAGSLWEAFEPTHPSLFQAP